MKKAGLKYEIIYSNSNRKYGKAEALNKALKYVKEDVTIVFDADDEVHSNYVEEVVNEVIEIWKTHGNKLILCSSLSGSVSLSVLGPLSPKYIVDEYYMPLYVNVSKTPWKYNVSLILIPKEEYYFGNEIYFKGLGGSFNYATLYYTNSTWRNNVLKYYELTSYPTMYLLVRKQ